METVTTSQAAERLSVPLSTLKAWLERLDLPLERLHAVHESDAKSPLIADYARLLYGQAVLAEGGQLGDPAGFAKALAAVMVLAAKG